MQYFKHDINIAPLIKLDSFVNIFHIKPISTMVFIGVRFEPIFLSISNYFFIISSILKFNINIFPDTTCKRNITFFFYLTIQCQHLLANPFKIFILRMLVWHPLYFFIIFHLSTFNSNAIIFISQPEAYP